MILKLRTGLVGSQQMAILFEKRWENLQPRVDVGNRAAVAAFPVTCAYFSYIPCIVFRCIEGVVVARCRPAPQPSNDVTPDELAAKHAAGVAVIREINALRKASKAKKVEAVTKSSAPGSAFTGKPIQFPDTASARHWWLIAAQNVSWRMSFVCDGHDFYDDEVWGGYRRTMQTLRLSLGTCVFPVAVSTRQSNGTRWLQQEHHLTLMQCTTLVPCTTARRWPHQVGVWW